MIVCDDQGRTMTERNAGSENLLRSATLLAILPQAPYEDPDSWPI